jgi:CPA2 family monovalent cation:H+ antiporter-2
VILAVVTWLAATWAARELRLSEALGAFAAGMILAGSPFAAQIRADVAPFRIVFVTLFFASLGLLADLEWLLEPAHLLAVLGLAAAIIVGKAVIVWAVVRPLGRAHPVALASGIALANIGEFSFVLAAIAHRNQLIHEDMFQLVVSATLLTLIATPPLTSHATSISQAINALAMRAGLWKPATIDRSPEIQKMTGHVIVVGYGPAGQAAAAAIQAAGIESVVIDLNPRLLAKAVADGRRASLADATRRETLEHLDIDSARALVITVPDHRAALLIVEQARAIAPASAILVRARYHTHLAALRQSGATVCIDEEELVGHVLGAETLMSMRIGDSKRD